MYSTSIKIMTEINSDCRKQEERMEIVMACARSGSSVDKTEATVVQSPRHSEQLSSAISLAASSMMVHTTEVRKRKTSKLSVRWEQAT